MNILGVEINRAKPAKNNVLEVDKNDYSDSVAGKLAARYGSSVTVNGRPTGAVYNQETIEEIYQGYIFAAIKKTSNTVAEILSTRIETFNPNDKDELALDDKHPYLKAIDLGKRDNTLFYKGIATYLMVLGEAFVDAGIRTMVAGNIKPVGSLELMQSNEVVRTYDDDGVLKSYKWKYKTPAGMEKTDLFVPTNVIAITDLNPWDLRKGYGQIRPIVDKIAVENMATKLQSAIIANGIKAPGIVSSKEELGEDEYQELQNQVKNRWTSNDMDKAGTPIVTNGGFVDYKSLIEDLDKLAMVKIRNMNRDAFMAALSVSKTILGIEESGTTRETSRIQREQFVLDACMPIANGILSALNQDYINSYPVEYAKKPIKMRAIAPIEKDLEQEQGEAKLNKEKAETFKTYIEAGTDPQQAAELAGITLKDDATIIVTPRPILVPPVAAPNAAPAPNVNIQNHNHSHDNDEPVGIPDVNKNALSKAELTKLEKAEAGLKTEIRQLDTGLGEKYIKNINNVSADEQQEYIGNVAKALVAYNTVSITIYGAQRAALMAKDFGVDAIAFDYNDAVRKIIEQRMTKVANGHFATVDKEITGAISKANADNLPRKEVIKAVREKVQNQVATWQVERLVQTEVSNAFNQSTFFADKQFIDGNGYTNRAYKVWRTNSPNPCPFCTGQSGTQVPFEDNFFNVGDVAEGTASTADGKRKQVYYPVRFVDINAGGLHPNCHCDYKLVIE